MARSAKPFGNVYQQQAQRSDTPTIQPIELPDYTNKEIYEASEIKKMEIYISDEPIRLVYSENRDFFAVLSQKLKWGRKI
jgi:hypothetical protein